ncbi:thermonuclease family protein [Histidinibacterium aquaticum]|uniref:Thermonuclease family protein n=1 Tax=Histidinibacterium aquaticum TaxID=2613962 RepID=A0A5J5GNP9_9RHOB|nr:thermonuclease family protein [Histidinibacterium aquaticum]KAA9009929.1 thermonuclease family protein [Histidinibacterium aquaticum]
MKSLAFCLALVLASGSATAQIAGPARVVDGDTLEVGGTTVRLHGIDAPEIDQTCGSASGADWACGRWVASRLGERIGDGAVSCRQLDTDRYGRAVARCATGERDLGAWLVGNGLAFAYRRYSMDYDLAEKRAAVAALGLWGYEVTSPAAFRRAGESEGPAPAGDCRIKGNVSNNGRIYHMPQDTYYAETRIDPARGERWFCSEAEARAAGWRRARR